MNRTVTLNPLTRISGFLEITVEIANHTIVDARSTGWLFRGFEAMLQGRPPLDATYFTERICGICSTAHSVASTMALEDALQIQVEMNGLLLRDVMHGAEFLQNHLRHFYQFTLPDYVRLNPALGAAFIADHSDYRLPQALNDQLEEHYRQSVRYSRSAHELLAVLGGKVPHNHGIFVGGVTVDLDISKLEKIKALLREIISFIDEIMIDDAQVIADYYRDYLQLGAGPGNFISYGLFNHYADHALRYVEPAVAIQGNSSPFDDQLITENIHHAWYQADQATQQPTHGQADPSYGKEGAYSWVKAPRYDGFPMEVGPLARLWLNGEYRCGSSTMHRTMARVLETSRIAHLMAEMLERVELRPAQQGRHQIPETAHGQGLTDTTRGSLGHWLTIERGRIGHYTIITPSGWNMSPMDSSGVKGVVEHALIGVPLQDQENPIEIGRIVRSFDPCISCATHVMGAGFAPLHLEILR